MSMMVKYAATQDRMDGKSEKGEKLGSEIEHEQIPNTDGNERTTKVWNNILLRSIEEGEQEGLWRIAVSPGHYWEITSPFMKQDS